MFADSNRKIVPYFCAYDKPTPWVESHFIDEVGNDVSLDAVRGDEIDAFRVRHNRMLPELRDEIDKVGTKAPIKADLWFAVPGWDDLPGKDQELVMTDSELLANSDTKRALTHGAASTVLQALSAMSKPPTVRSVGAGADGAAPLIRIVAPADTLSAVGQLEGVVALGVSYDQEPDPLTSEAYYDLDQLPYVQDTLGWTGAGMTIADIEGSPGVYDSTELGLAGGSCVPPFGPSYKCSCPVDAPTVPFETHMQMVLGVVKNNNATLRGGSASGATVIAGLIDATNCPNTDAYAWSAAQGASVFNRPGATGGGRNLDNYYLDYLATQSPYPLVSASAGNGGLNGVVGNILANGLVVGGADDQGNTSRNALKHMYNGSQSVNPAYGAGGWELPHLIAPAVSISTVGSRAGDPTINPTGTSFAAPQVSGVAATLQQAQPALRSWPEGMMAVLIAGPEQDVAGGWPMSLSDGVDDQDGAGALNAYTSLMIAQHKVDGGNTGIPYGFDEGSILASQYPNGTFYGETYNALVPPGATLRVALVPFARVTCSQPPSQANCTAETFPFFAVAIYGLNGSLLSQSANGNGNYQYTSWKNTACCSAATVQIKFWPANWYTLSSTTWGLAWCAA